ncbi:carboxypeptidase-like regulatory domain-containing protein [Bacteroides thetaiotaomicron]|nr:carboxypeptidase-like regulatory domain-containing protein [Bacteroides thetaiotaomicron]
MGANVSVKDVPGLGTITDLNGRYVIKKWNLTIAWYFPYIVYQSQEVLIKNQSKVNIVLKRDVTNAID